MGVTYLPPAHAEWQLLAGDESALPAILAILEHAPATLAPTRCAHTVDAVSHTGGCGSYWMPRRT